VVVTDSDGSTTTYNPDGTITVSDSEGKVLFEGSEDDFNHTYDDSDGVLDIAIICSEDFGDPNNDSCSTEEVADCDGDGILDNEDLRPFDSGSGDNGGRPVQQVIDSDGDGIADPLDGCPAAARTSDGQ
jgi:hypothetical protein